MVGGISGSINTLKTDLMICILDDIMYKIAIEIKQNVELPHENYKKFMIIIQINDIVKSIKELTSAK